MASKKDFLTQLKNQFYLTGLDDATKKGRDWFIKKAEELTAFGPSIRRELETRKSKTNKARQRATPMIGDMFFFAYDPKWKAKLPYYDTFPLVFPFQIEKDRFYGLNLHYLSPIDRAKLLDALSKNVNNDFYNDTTKMQISYNIIRTMGMAKPCIKSYLFTHVQSKFIRIHPSEWTMSIFLPTESFVKASKSEVWQESKRIASK